MNLDKERELFLKSKLIKGIKFETLEHYMDGNLVIFIDKILNFMWHSWLASASREGYKLVPVEPTIEMLEGAADEHVLRGASYAGIYKAMIGAVE